MVIVGSRKNSFRRQFKTVSRTQYLLGGLIRHQHLAGGAANHQSDIQKIQRLEARSTQTARRVAQGKRGGGP
jgi:hypothetical protein